MARISCWHKQSLQWYVDHWKALPSATTSHTCLINAAACARALGQSKCSNVNQVPACTQSKALAGKDVWYMSCSGTRTCSDRKVHNDNANNHNRPTCCWSHSYWKLAYNMHAILKTQLGYHISTVPPKQSAPLDIRKPEGFTVVHLHTWVPQRPQRISLSLLLHIIEPYKLPTMRSSLWPINVPLWRISGLLS